jgi:hypothetical protein
VIRIHGRLLWVTSTGTIARGGLGGARTRILGLTPRLAGLEDIRRPGLDVIRRMGFVVHWPSVLPDVGSRNGLLRLRSHVAPHVIHGCVSRIGPHRGRPSGEVREPGPSVAHLEGGGLRIADRCLPVRCGGQKRGLAKRGLSVGGNAKRLLAKLRGS